MSIAVGVSGVIKNVSSVKCGVSGVVKNVSHGYNGVSGIKRQFFGPETGIQYFLAIPTNKWVGLGDEDILKYNKDLSFIGTSTSGSYTIYKYRSETIQNYYTEEWFYKNNNRSYPKTYYADYVLSRVVATTNTTYSETRGTYNNYRICAIYENETFENLESYTIDIPSPSRNSYLHYYRADGRYPSTFSVTCRIKFDGTRFNYSNPRFYSNYASQIGSDYTYNLTTNQSTAMPDGNHNLGTGVYISPNYTYTVTQTIQFPSQSITFNGTSYPIYFSFAPLKHTT